MNWWSTRGQVTRKEQEVPWQPAIAVLPWVFLFGVKLFDVGFGKKFSGSLACQA
jgi:hypothetical protein